jgi:hypothetical protein
MGVEKFLGAILSQVPICSDDMRRKSVSVVIDANQFIHNSFEMMLEYNSRVVKSPGVNEGGSYYFDKSTKEEITVLYSRCCKTVILKLKNELSHIDKLEELYITMDGFPCLGKVQNQIGRRKNTKKCYDKAGNLVFSGGFILPGTQVMDIFRVALNEELIAFQQEKGIYLYISSSAIAGEGEHKALDIVRHLPYTSLTSNPSSHSDSKHVLLWSNDSDIIISLVHQEYSNIYIMTDHVIGKEKTTKCVDIVSIRTLLCRNITERLNSSLLLALAGNDYLPQMLDTVELLKANQIHHTIASFDLTKEMLDEKQEQKPVPINIEVSKTSEVSQVDFLQSQNNANSNANAVSKKHSYYSLQRVINFEALRLFFRGMAEIEIELYHKSPERHPLFDPANLERYLGDRISFKRDYYQFVNMQLQNKIYGRDSIPTYDMSEKIEVDLENPTNEQLYKLEMNMALAWMKTYVWYYYYQSGYSVNFRNRTRNADNPESAESASVEFTSSLDNSFYPYGMSPLYSSLYILLDRQVRDYHVQFNFELNKSITPVMRNLEYFNSLPSFTVLHHFIVLQDEELELLYGTSGDGSSAKHGDVRYKYNQKYGELLEVKKKPYSTIPEIRLRRKAPLQVYPFINVFAILMNSNSSESGEIMTFGEKKVSERVQKTQFVVKGKATFPQ